MSEYAWRITRDLLAEQDPELSSDAGVYGPGDITREQKTALLDRENTVLFQLLDDDEIVYYQGDFLGDAESEDAFGPLDDFGTPNAGAVTIRFRNPGTGLWEEL
jgi:hypothetical protein